MIASLRCPFFVAGADVPLAAAAAAPQPVLIAAAATAPLPAPFSADLFSAHIMSQSSHSSHQYREPASGWRAALMGTRARWLDGWQFLFYNLPVLFALAILFFHATFNAPTSGVDMLCNFLHNVFFFVGLPFPRTLRALRPITQLPAMLERTVTFIMCPKCRQPYPIGETWAIDPEDETKRVARVCQYVAFPNHPNAAGRRPCGGVLMAARMISGELKLTHRPSDLFKYIGA